jgi:hypothetical protein
VTRVEILSASLRGRRQRHREAERDRRLRERQRKVERAARVARQRERTREEIARFLSSESGARALLSRLGDVGPDLAPLHALALAIVREAKVAREWRALRRELGVSA